MKILSTEIFTPYPTLIKTWGQYLCLIFSLLMLLGCDDAKGPDKSFEAASIGINAAKINAKDNAVIIGSVHHGISYWSTDKTERLFNWNHKQGEFTTLIAAAFSADGKRALSADTHTLSLWDTETGKSLRFWRAPAEILDISVGPQGQFALLGLSDHTAVIFDVVKGGIARTFTHSNRVRSVALSKDGKIALTGSEDYSSRAFDTQTGKELARQEMKDDVQIVTISDDGTLAFSMAKYDTAMIWEIKTGKILGRLKLRGNLIKFGIRYHSAKISEDNKYLLVGRSDEKVELWQVKGFQKLHTWKLPKRNSWKPQGVAVLDVAFKSKSGQYMAVASNGFVHHLSR